MRTLQIPTVADRIAQMVVKLTFEPLVEPIFHPDSYGYRPGRSALRLLAHRAAEGRIQWGGLRLVVAKNGLHGDKWRSLIEQHSCECVSHMGNSPYQTLDETAARW